MNEWVNYFSLFWILQDSLSIPSEVIMKLVTKTPYYWLIPLVFSFLFPQDLSESLTGSQDINLSWIHLDTNAQKSQLIWVAIQNLKLSITLCVYVIIITAHFRVWGSNKIIRSFIFPEQNTGGSTF